MLIPEENVKDLAEIPANVKEGLEIIPVAHVDQVLEHALTSLPAADRMDRGRRSRQPAGLRWPHPGAATTAH